MSNSIEKRKHVLPVSSHEKKPEVQPSGSDQFTDFQPSRFQCWMSAIYFFVALLLAAHIDSLTS